MKELVSQIPFVAVGYDIVPCGMVAKIGEDNYRQDLLANNDYNNCICSIEVLYMHSSHLDLTVTYKNAEEKIGEWFNNSPFIIDVQPTNCSEEIGKYFIIVEEQHIVRARKEVVSLLRIFQNNAEAYGNHYPRLPCIANGPLSDGATERFADFLAKKFSSLKSDSPPTTQKGIEELSAWTPARNECVFVWQSTREFPPPSVTSQATRATPVSRTTQAQSQVTFPDGVTQACLHNRYRHYCFRSQNSFYRVHGSSVRNARNLYANKPPTAATAHGSHPKPTGDYQQTTPDSLQPHGLHGTWG
jgi:hypothetical protein